MNDEDFMRMAIEKSRESVREGQTPFGAVIVKEGRVLAKEHNRVWADMDITAHAEMVAIRRACKELGTIDLSGCTIYSSCEPCPMCFSAIHWAKIDRIVYGARISDAKEHGFNELPIYNQKMAKMGESEVEVIGDFLRKEALMAFEAFSRKAKDKVY